MKTFMISVMAMVSMFSVNANASEVNASEVSAPAISTATTEVAAAAQDSHETTTLVYKYKDDTMLSEYTLQDGEVISRTIYKYSYDTKRYKPCMKYAVSKNADTSILSCGYWDESTKDFSANITSQTFPTSQYPHLLVLPCAK